MGHEWHEAWGMSGAPVSARLTCHSDRREESPTRDNATHPFALDVAGGRSGATVTFDRPPVTLGIDK